MDFTQFSSYNGHEPIGAALPEIPIKKQYYAQLGLPEDTPNKELLRVLCRRGVKTRLIDKKENKKVYYDQIKFELESFEEMGMVDYILALWDIINFCKEEDVLVGRGRGSAASSLVLYCLGVTGIDPIKHKLFFERFISKDRIKKVGEIDGKSYFDGGMLPDVDLDIDYADRHKVITYLEQNYKGKSSKIITFNTYSLKLCIREVCKFFLKYNEEQADRISNLIPKLHGNVANIDEAIELNEEFKKWASQNEYAIKQTRKIEGLIKNAGCHPSGIAISYEDINSIMPMQKTKDGDLIASYDMEDVAELAVKMDILGLKTLTVVKKACEKAGISLEDIDVDDPFIYQQLQDFNAPAGLFQISADTNFRVCQKVKPMNLGELSDVIAIARPGALAALDEYIKQKQTFEPLGMHPKLDEILGDTKNVLLYQESAMRVTKEVFQMQAIDAESLRKVIGKKQREKIPFWKDKIYKQGEKIKLDKKVIDYFWGIVEASANYSFNLSHSISYSYLTSHTIFLKFKYPKEWFCAMLEMAKNEPDPHEMVNSVTHELPQFNIKLLPPSLEKSQMDFTIEEKGIRYGLEQIKGISSKTLEGLILFRGKSFDNKYSIFEIAKECGLSITHLTALIHAGALQDGEGNRGLLALEAQAFNQLTVRERKFAFIMGEQYNWKLLKWIADCVEKQLVDEKEKPIFSAKRFETFKRDFNKYKRLYETNQKHIKLATWVFEDELMGCSFTYNLKDCFDDRFDALIDLQGLKALPKNAEAKIVAKIKSVRSKITQKSKNRYISLEVMDDFGNARIMMFEQNRMFEETLEKKLKKGQIIVISGRSTGDGSIFADFIDRIDNVVFTKTRGLK